MAQGGLMQDQSVKTDAGKPLAGCLLEFPKALTLMARVSTFGAAKYGRNSWNRVQRQRYVDAFMRHVLAMKADADAVDPETGLPHAAHALWNLAAILELAKQKRKRRLSGIFQKALSIVTAPFLFWRRHETHRIPRWI